MGDVVDPTKMEDVLMVDDPFTQNNTTVEVESKKLYYVKVPWIYYSVSVALAC